MCVPFIPQNAPKCVWHLGPAGTRFTELPGPLAGLRERRGEGRWTVEGRTQIPHCEVL